MKSRESKVLAILSQAEEMASTGEECLHRPPDCCKCQHDHPDTSIYHMDGEKRVDIPVGCHCVRRKPPMESVPIEDHHGNAVPIPETHDENGNPKPSKGGECSRYNCLDCLRLDKTEFCAVMIRLQIAEGL